MTRRRGLLAKFALTLSAAKILPGRAALASNGHEVAWAHWRAARDLMRFAPRLPVSAQGLATAHIGAAAGAVARSLSDCATAEGLARGLDALVANELQQGLILDDQAWIMTPTELVIMLIDKSANGS